MENNDKRRPLSASFAPGQKKGVVPAAIATLGPFHIPPLLPTHPTPSASPPSTPLRSDIRQATHDSFTL